MCAPVRAVIFIKFLKDSQWFHSVIFAPYAFTEQMDQLRFFFRRVDEYRAAPLSLFGMVMHQINIHAWHV